MLHSNTGMDAQYYTCMEVQYCSDIRTGMEVQCCSAAVLHALVWRCSAAVMNLYGGAVLQCYIGMEV